MVGRAGEQTIVMGCNPVGTNAPAGRREGTLVIEGEREIVEGPHPLAPFGDTAYAAAQVHRLAHFPHTGDLVVLGAVEPDGKVVTFEEQAATHGGLGGPQGRPFITWPPECPLAPETLNDAQDLYPYFVQRYMEQPLAEEVDDM